MLEATAVYYGSASGTTSLGVLLVPLLFLAALSLLGIAGLWKMYAKAGVPGWGAIVPFYNSYLYLQLGGLDGRLFLVCFIPFVGGLVLFVLMIIAALQIAKDFGKGTGFGIGLAFLPFIFAVILGFGSAEYQGVVVQGGVTSSRAGGDWTPRPSHQFPTEGPFASQPTPVAPAPSTPAPPAPVVQSPPAGWFADPQNPSQLRYWDGTAWTEHTHPNPPAE